MLIGAILFPALAGIVVSLWKTERNTRRTAYLLVVLGTDALGILAMVRGTTEILFPLAEDLPLVLALDGVGRWFMAAALILYTAVVFYAFPYMEVEEREEVFFAFLFVSWGAMLSVCMAGNLVTLYLCFELLTLTSMPLVLHELNGEAVAAALKYLFYSIGGALLGLLAVMVLCAYAGDAGSFVPGGFLDLGRVEAHRSVALWAVFAGIVGFGAKAGMYPLHGWLPVAHPAAPAPASALLSGIIAKAGILAEIRLVFFSAGAGFLRGTWVQTAWTTLALCTVLMGSMTAFREKVMKKRLAYSTISQISYIMAGLSLLDEEGLAGGLVHVAAHAASKGVLFLCAGVFIYRLGIRQVADLRGIGKKMPITMWCYLFASLSLVGIPPMGGFVSKWMIAGAALRDGRGAFAVLIPVILLISALLTAGYLLPVAVDAFFPGREEEEEAHSVRKGDHSARKGDKRQSHPVPPPVESQEPPLWMTVPMSLLCVCALCTGLFAGPIAELLTRVLSPLF